MSLLNDDFLLTTPMAKSCSMIMLKKCRSSISIVIWIQRKSMKTRITRTSVEFGLTKATSATIISGG